MSNRAGKKGTIDRVEDNKLEKLLNLLGPDKTAEKLEVSLQALYRNFNKRGGMSKTIYIIPGSQK